MAKLLTYWLVHRCVFDLFFCLSRLFEQLLSATAAKIYHSSLNFASEFYRYVSATSKDLTTYFFVSKLSQYLAQLFIFKAFQVLSAISYLFNYATSGSVVKATTLEAIHNKSLSLRHLTSLFHKFFTASPWFVYVQSQLSSIGNFWNLMAYSVSESI